MANQYVNKVVVGGETKLDLTGDTVVADKLAKGYKAHDKSGAPIVGTNTYDADTGDATAAAAEILDGKTAYVAGNKVVGVMPNKGAVTGEVTTKTEQFAIPAGFHDGSGKVGISSAAQLRSSRETLKKVSPSSASRVLTAAKPSRLRRTKTSRRPSRCRKSCRTPGLITSPKLL